MQFGSLKRRQAHPEGGYILIIFLVVLTLMMIALTAAAPRLAQQIQRDHEIEMIHRGEAYMRAIKRYYKKFGRYPGRIEDLENTNTIRFLRKRYKDPVTGGPWRLVRYGEVQLLSPPGGIGTPAQALGQATSPQAGSQSGIFNLNFSGTPGPQNPASATAPGASSAGGILGSTATTSGTTGATGTPATTGTTGTTDTTSGTTDSTSGTTATTGSTGQTGSSLFGQTGTGSPGQATGSSNSLFSSPAGSAQPGAGGGGAIIGVASLSKKKGIHEFNKKSAYNDWLFIYDPAQDRGQLLHGPYDPQAFFGQITQTPPAGGIGQGTTNTTGAQGLSGTSSPTTTMPSSTGSSGGLFPSTR